MQPFTGELHIADGKPQKENQCELGWKERGMQVCYSVMSVQVTVWVVQTVMHILSCFRLSVPPAQLTSLLF